MARYFYMNLAKAENSLKLTMRDESSVYADYSVRRILLDFPTVLSEGVSLVRTLHMCDLQKTD
jgi:hypothetical protein